MATVPDLRGGWGRRCSSASPGRTARGSASGSTSGRVRAGSSPGSPITQVHGDASMFVGGLRALLLQTLHPAAMRAVYEHSGFRGDCGAGCTAPAPSSR